MVGYLKYLKRKLTAPCPVTGYGAVNIFSKPEGFKIFLNNKEITKNSGLGLSWLDNENIFHDLTSFKPAKVKWHKNSIENFYLTDKLQLSFCLTINSPLTIAFTIDYSFQEKPQQIKIPLFMSDNYTYWLVDYSEGVFPRQRDIWQNIPTPLKEGGTAAGVRDSENYPVIILETAEYSHFLENSSLNDQARVISALKNSPSEEGTIKGEIKLLYKEQFTNWLTDKRRKLLAQ